MITDFETFCLWVLCIVDDVLAQSESKRVLRRPGPAPQCSDSELITMALVGECLGWAVETELLSGWARHCDLFPHLPSQSRFNRRRRQLMMVFNLVRQSVLGLLDLAADRQCVIDSLPIPVVRFHLAPCASREWFVQGARYGTISAKKGQIYGYKLHLLVTRGGLILDFTLAPANVQDLHVGAELLAEYTDLQVVGDKAYISEGVAAQLLIDNRITLLTLRRANQREQLPPALSTLINQTRQIIETVNGQLAAQFNIEQNYAHSFAGLCTRLYTKLTAHTLCIFINRLVGKSDFLHIKSLAFPFPI